VYLTGRTQLVSADSKFKVILLRRKIKNRIIHHARGANVYEVSNSTLLFFVITTPQVLVITAMANQLSEKDLSIAPRQGRMLIMPVNATKFPLTKRPPKRQVFGSGTAHPGFVLGKNSCRKSKRSS
jgi:hypothetical protein